MSNSTDITWPGEEDGDAVMAQWYFDDGDGVESGDVICDLALEKTVVEITSPVSGTLQIIIRQVDAEVPPGALIARINQ